MGRNQKQAGTRNITTLKKGKHTCWDPHLSEVFSNAYGHEGCTQVKGQFCWSWAVRISVQGSRKGGLIVHGKSIKKRATDGEGGQDFHKNSQILSWLLHYTCAGWKSKEPVESNSWKLKELSWDVNSCLILERQSPSNWEEPSKQFEHSTEILEGP